MIKLVEFSVYFRRHFLKFLFLLICAGIGVSFQNCQGYSSGSDLNTLIQSSQGGTIRQYRTIFSSSGAGYAIDIEGKIYAWGMVEGVYFLNGNLEARPQPVLFASDEKYVKGVGGGYGHSCAITEGKLLKCWGINRAGALGDGTTTDSKTPVLVSGISNVEDVVVGYDYTCALTSSTSSTTKNSYCWGGGTLVPTLIPGFDNVKQLAATYTRPCAINSSNDLLCYEKSESEGFSSTRNPSLFTAPGKTKFLFSSLTNDLCGVGTTDIIWCFRNLMTVDVVGSESVKSSIGGSRSHYCFVNGENKIKCWGGNGFGQLADSSMADSAAPKLVQQLSDANQVTHLEYGTCALVASSRIYCWGLGSFNVIPGVADGGYSSTPTRINGL